jgi:hypothetical protein
LSDKRRHWTRTIEKAKRDHWRQFLDQAGEGHLWKVVTYLQPQVLYATIPPLLENNKEATRNQDNPRVLMESFFPRMAAAREEGPPEPTQEIPWEPITKDEIHRSLMSAKGSAAPGEDGKFQLWSESPCGYIWQR